MNKNEITRRKFIQAGLATAGAVSFPGIANAQQADNSIQWEKTFDVIVVGSGLAGLSAGISAAEAGSKTVILDKMPAYGGSSVISGGTFAAANSRLQKKQKIEDSVEQFTKDLLVSGKRLNNVKLAELLAKNSADAHQFLVDRGARYSEKLRKVAGHTNTRCYQPAENMGVAVIAPLYEHYLTLSKATFELKVKVIDLIKDENNRIIGVKVKQGYLFDQFAKNDDRENKTGIVKYYKANKAVIMATGGFSRDYDFREKEFPQYTKVPSTVRPSATAGSLKMMQKCGIRAIQLSLVRFGISIGYEDIEKGLLLDQIKGERFISEAESRMSLSYKIIDQVNSTGGGFPVLIYDAIGFENIYDREKLHIILNNGEMQKFDDIESLAKYFDTPKEKALQSIERYNELIKNNLDEDFEKDFIKTMSSSISKAPFYACSVYPKFNYTMGGMAINENSQAYYTETDEVVDGLYVCGEASCGIHGAVRMTGCSTVDCTVFGIIAGNHAHQLTPVK